MNRFRSCTGLRLLVLMLALLVIAAAGAACGGTVPAASTGAAPAQAAKTPGVADPASATPGAQPTVKESDLPVGVDADGHFYRGNRMATVKLVEFTDFQCLFCARHATQTAPLIDQKYIAIGQVLHVFRNYPIPSLGHKNAVPAAFVAYCAGQQSPQFFWAMNDWLFANQKVWASVQDAADKFRQEARSLGVEPTRYDVCLTAPDTKAAIERDIREGNALGVHGTPTFFINDWSVVGAYPFTEFQKVIGKTLQGIAAPPTPTRAPRPTPTP